MKCYKRLSPLTNLPRRQAGHLEIAKNPTQTLFLAVLIVTISEFQTLKSRRTRRTEVLGPRVTNHDIVYLRGIRAFKGEPGQIFQLETLPSRKYTVDDPYFQEDSLSSVGVPCAASTSSLVEPAVKYPWRNGPGPEGNISALSGEPGEISQPVTLPLWKYTVDDPYFQEDSLNSAGVPCAASTSSLVEPAVKYPGRWPGPEGSISALSGELGQTSQLVTLPSCKYTVDDPYFKKDSPNSVGVPCTASTSSLVEPTLKYPDWSVGRGAILDSPRVSVTVGSACDSVAARSGRPSDASPEIFPVSTFGAFSRAWDALLLSPPITCEDALFDSECG